MVNTEKEPFDYDKYHKENIEPYIKSKGAQKMWNYFLDIAKKEYFIQVIRELREKYNIPADGYNHGDKYTSPPAEFNRNLSGKLRDDIVEKICKKYKLHYFDFTDVLLEYIFFNHLNPLNELGSCGLFRVMDIIEEKEEPFGQLFQDSDDITYPIAIRISPYASQRDIVDFVKNKAIWKKEIEFLQNKYKDKNVKTGKIKAKNKKIQQRNEYIYINRDKTLKEIRKLLADQKIYLDDGHISKIISLERQRRKEV